MSHVEAGTLPFGLHRGETHKTFKSARSVACDACDRQCRVEVGAVATASPDVGGKPEGWPCVGRHVGFKPAWKDVGCEAGGTVGFGEHVSAIRSGTILLACGECSAPCLLQATGPLAVGQHCVVGNSRKAVWYVAK